MLLVAIVSLKAYKNKQRANVIISEQKATVEKQKHLVDEKQKEILDSIRYAKRIQISLLPTEKYIDICLKQCYLRNLFFESNKGKQKYWM